VLPFVGATKAPTWRCGNGWRQHFRRGGRGVGRSFPIPGGNPRQAHGWPGLGMRSSRQTARPIARAARHAARCGARMGKIEEERRGGTDSWGPAVSERMRNQRGYLVVGLPRLGRPDGLVGPRLKHRLGWQVKGRSRFRRRLVAKALQLVLNLDLS
jgi:hypothetical protein